MFTYRINDVININIFWNVKPWSYLDGSDLTLETNETGNLVSNRHPSDELSLSDHRHICFQMGNTAITWVTFRDPKITNWEPYKYDGRQILRPCHEKLAWYGHKSGCWPVATSHHLSYHSNCPSRTTRSLKKVCTLVVYSWVNWVFNVAKTKGCWATYKEGLTCYSKEIKKDKWSSWRRHCL
jgi:hypothetical protein